MVEDLRLHKRGIIALLRNIRMSTRQTALHNVSKYPLNSLEHELACKKHSLLRIPAES